MKTYNNLFPKIVSFENLYLAYQKASRAKHYRQPVLKFNWYLERNLIELQRQLSTLNTKEFQSSWASWQGYAKFAKSWHLRKKIYKIITAK